MSDLLDLLLAFTRIGLFGFGGGPSMIPLVEAEVVGTYGWLTRPEFLDAFAFGNALPGPIVTKLAGYVGYQVAGVPGAVVALVGIVLPTVLMMVGLASLYARYRHLAVIRNFLLGVRPVIVALLAVVIWEFAPGAFGVFEGWWLALPLLLAAGTLFLLVRFPIHPALLIVAGGLAGLLLNGG